MKTKGGRKHRLRNLDGFRRQRELILQEVHNHEKESFPVSFYIILEIGKVDNDLFCDYNLK